MQLHEPLLGHLDLVGRHDLVLRDLRRAGFVNDLPDLEQVASNDSIMAHELVALLRLLESGCPKDGNYLAPWKNRNPVPKPTNPNREKRPPET